jgi:hypothetical protein
MTATPSVDAPLTDLARQHRRVAVLGLAGTGKTSRLLGHYRRLLDEGVPSEAVLVLASSATRGRWHEAVATDPIGASGAWQVQTFLGFVQRELLDWWLAIEAAGTLPPCARPEGPHDAHLLDLARVSLAQYLMARHTHAERLELEWDRRLHTPASLQVIHLLDSLGRTIEHELPLGGIGDRLAAGWAGTTDVARCHAELQGMLDGYRDWMLGHRVLDHALQLLVYRDHLWPLPAYRADLRQRTRHLIIDDVEETYPLAQRFLAELDAEAETAVYARNTSGGLREYVGADPVGADALLEGCFAVVIPDAVAGAPSELRALGQSLWLKAVGREAPPVALGQRYTGRLAFGTRLAMLKAVSEDVRVLLETGTPPGEIAILAPSLDPFLIWHLRQDMERLGAPLDVLAGTNRLVDHRPVRLFLTLAKAAHPAWKVPPARHEWLELLEVLLGLDALALAQLAPAMLDDGWLAPPETLPSVMWPAETRSAYRHLCDWLNTAIATPPRPIDQFFRHAFADLWAPLAPRHLPAERWLEAELQAQEVDQIHQLIESAQHFRRLVGALEGLDEMAMGRRFLGYLLGGTLAERPFRRPGEARGSITLATAAKYAEDGRPVAFQFWLDVGATSWWKSDLRELTNPRVLSRRWDGEPYTPERDETESDAKLGRILWTNCLKVRRGLRWYASLVDAEGREQTGALPHLMESLTLHTPAGLEVSP